MSRDNVFFESTLEKLGRIMSRKHGLNIVIEGNMAYTDGKTIYLPALEDVKEELRADLLGLLDHEVAHCKYTDFEAMTKLINRFHKELFNAIEDSRIELLLPQEYPGTALTLERLNQKWSAKLDKTRKDMPWPIRLILCLREIYDGRTIVSDPQIEPLIASVLDDAKELRKATNSKTVISMTAEIIRKINLAREDLAKGLSPINDEELAEFEKFRGQTSVELDPNRKDREATKAQGAETYDPATEMRDEEGGDKSDSDGAESENSDKSGDSKKTGSSDKASISAEKDGDEAGGDKDGADGDGKGESGLDNKKDKTEQSDKDTSKTSDEKTAADSDYKKDATLEKRHDYATWSESATEAKMMRDSIDDTDSEFNNHEFSTESYMDAQFEEVISKEPKVQNLRGMYDSSNKINPKLVSIPYTKQYDKVINHSGKGDRKDYATRKLAIMKFINPIKQHMERVLKVKENRKTIPEQERGRLNTRTLAKLCIDKNYRSPFSRFSKIDTSNVAVSLVIDCSGSMQGNKIEVARQTGLALGESLKALNIVFEMTGFNTTGSSGAFSDSRGVGDISRFNRYGEALRLMVFKDFNTNDLSGICNAAAGGANADGESITWAAKRLAERKEKRKIMIVLSDGQPSYGGANHDVLAGDLRRIVLKLPKAGIECIGIGIQTDCVRKFYDDYVVVNDIKKLGTQVVKKLAGLLEDGYTGRGA